MGKTAERQLLLRYYDAKAGMTKVKGALRRARLPVQAVWDVEEHAWAFTCPVGVDNLRCLALEKIVQGYIAYYGKQ